MGFLDVTHCNDITRARHPHSYISIAISRLYMSSSGRRSLFLQALQTGQANTQVQIQPSEKLSGSSYSTSNTQYHQQSEIIHGQLIMTYQSVYVERNPKLCTTCLVATDSGLFTLRSGVASTTYKSRFQKIEAFSLLE